MKTGIIGAGRVGCSLGKYFRSKNADLVGYYDTNTAAAEEAAAFTQTPVSIRCSNWCVNQTSSSSRHPIRSLYPYGKKSKACHTGIRLYVIVVAHFHPIHFPEPKKQEYPAARFIPCYRSVTNFHHTSNQNMHFLPWKATNMPYRSSPTYSLPMEMKSAGLMPQPSQNIMQLPAS